MSILNKIGNKLLKNIDNFVIKYLTVERGRNKRKWIWHTKDFREATQIYIPRCLFIGFVVFMCWKIKERVKFLQGGVNINYEAKSHRQEKVEREEQEIEYFLSIPNEFDPDKAKNNPVSVEYKDVNKYEYHDLTDDQISKLDQFDEWIKEIKKKN